MVAACCACTVKIFNMQHVTFLCIKIDNRKHIRLMCKRISICRLHIDLCAEDFVITGNMFHYSAHKKWWYWTYYINLFSIIFSVSHILICRVETINMLHCSKRKRVTTRNMFHLCTNKFRIAAYIYIYLCRIFFNNM